VGLPFGPMTGAAGEGRAGGVTSWPDIVLALTVGVVQVAGAAHFAAPYEPHARQVDVLGLMLLAATPLALIVRRRWPVQVYVVAFAATAAYQALGYVAGPEWLGLLVAFVTVIVAGYRWIAVSVLLADYVLSQWLPPLLGTGHGPGWRSL
jgi:hypothetical protein